MGYPVFVFKHEDKILILVLLDLSKCFIFIHIYYVKLVLLAFPETSK